MFKSVLNGMFGYACIEIIPFQISHSGRFTRVMRHFGLYLGGGGWGERIYSNKDSLTNLSLSLVFFLSCRVTRLCDRAEDSLDL